VGRPTPSSAAVTSRMQRQRRRDTVPEMALRKAVHARGLRYRVDSPLPGMPRRRADLLLTRARIAIFVDGCFWHGCPDHASASVSNAEWWAAKLLKNQGRDASTDEHLRGLGWAVLRFWEHEDMGAAAGIVVGTWRSRIDRVGRRCESQGPTSA